MNRRELILGPLKETWPIKKNELYLLGEWCKLSAEKKFWENYNFKILDYHWNDRTKLKQDFIYLQQKNKKLLKYFQEYLNKLHNLKYNEKSWLSILGPWLMTSIAVLYDRWSSINSALSNEIISKVKISKFVKDEVVPFNMDHFSYLIKTDEWNFLIFSMIIKNFEHHDIRNIKIINHKSNFKNKLNYNDKNIKNNFFLLKCYNFISKFNDSLIYNINLNWKDRIKLIMFEKNIPFVLRIKNISTSSINFKLRKNLFSNLIVSDEFDSILIKVLPYLIPQVYLEDFKCNFQLAKLFPSPTKPKFVWTTGAYFFDEIFKFKAAEAIHEKVPYIIGQHGGFYGQGLFDQSEDFEVSVSDHYFSWGWNSKKNKKIIPVGCFKAPVKRKKNNYKITLIISSCSRYSSYLASMPISSQCRYYNDDQINLIKNLSEDVLEKLHIRLYPYDFKWNLKKEMNEKIKGLNFINNNKKFNSLLAESKLIINGWNSTSYLESIMSDIPTVIFWSNNYTEMRNDSLPYFKELKSVGIFHQDYMSAAKQINKINSDIDGWWNSVLVKNAKDMFIKKYAKREAFSDNIFNQLKKIKNN